MYGESIHGFFATPSATATAGTAFAQLVPPFRGAQGSPATLHKVVNNRRVAPKSFTQINRLVYEPAGTVHDVVVMRPLNWAEVDADVAANSAVIVLKTDPGVYASNYKYDLPPEAAGLTASVAANGIAASDYCAYQLRDGTWVVDTVSSVSGLSVTMATATPNITGGGIAAGTVLYFFGVAADKDPATGQAHAAFKSKASTRLNLLEEGGLAAIPSLHPGDPVLIYSANGTAAGILVTAAGHYFGT